jgi:hypothetical protein
VASTLELDPDFRSGHPIWQGDLLGFGDWERAHPLERYGVIVTADCDIQQARPDRDVVYLRIVSQKDYIDFLWAKEKLEKIRDRCLADATEMINRLRRQQEPEVVDLELSEVDRWTAEASADEICASILKPEHSEKSRLLANIGRFQKAALYCQQTAGKACLSKLSDIQARSITDLMKTAGNELSDVRDNLFFILGFQEREDKVGYYVLLDHIGAVARDHITDSLGELRRGSKKAYRFGRLNQQFKYAMVQKFAFLFQRIGLPDAHKDSHGSSLQQLSKPSGALS